MDIVGALDSVADIWSGITSFGIDSGAGAESCGGGKRLLAQDRHLLEIFGRGPCRFGVFGLGSTSVEDVNATERSPWEDMPCVYIGRQ